jgi:hypothetical protein
MSQLHILKPTIDQTSYQYFAALRSRLQPCLLSVASRWKRKTLKERLSWPLDEITGFPIARQNKRKSGF